MTFDSLPDQFETFIDRAGETFRDEVARWRKARDTAKADLTTLQSEGATLRASLSQLQSQRDVA